MAKTVFFYLKLSATRSEAIESSLSLFFLRKWLGKSHLPKIHKNCLVDFIHFNGAVFVNFWMMRFSKVRSLKKQTLSLCHEQIPQHYNFIRKQKTLIRIKDRKQHFSSPAALKKIPIFMHLDFKLPKNAFSE